MEELVQRKLRLRLAGPKWKGNGRDRVANAEQIDVGPGSPSGPTDDHPVIAGGRRLHGQGLSGAYQIDRRHQ